MARRKARMRKSTKETTKETVVEAMKMPAKQVKRPVKGPGESADTAAQIPVIDEPQPSVRRSGRAARQSYALNHDPDEEMEEAPRETEEEIFSDFDSSKATFSDFDSSSEMDIKEEDDDTMSASENSVAENESIRSTSVASVPEDRKTELTVSVATKKENWSFLDGKGTNRKAPSKSSQAKPTAKKAPTTKPKSKKRDLQLDLPPLNNIRDIFFDITKKALKTDPAQDLVQGLKNDLRDVIDHFEGTPLRVGTMCSGTESPILALRLVQQSLKEKLGIMPFRLDHVFSAEIEPYKQAYIERNFGPELLFRDITEMYQDDEMNMKGTTAYGAVEDVPKDIHILVAGCSCVDFSTLNTTQINGFGERKGESEDTFLAVLRYTDYARPPIVILENVTKDKPWKEFQAHFDAIGYATQVVEVDSKEYYIPQTRQRRYMLALDKALFENDASQELALFQTLMKTHFKRHASSAIPSFLIPSDDPRHIALLNRNQTVGRGIKGLNTNWEACRGRHLSERSRLSLGPKKPVTTKLPEHCGRRWMMDRVARQADFIDIYHLMEARKYVDSLFKTHVLNLSQK